MMETRSISKGDDPYTGPYKATRLWNDVISAFRENMPCGRHRRLMRTFDDCFSGSGASDWLLQYLKSNRNFGSDVRREKAVSLLSKLYTAGIFEEVKVSKTMQHKPNVQENRLYRMLPGSPSKSKTTRLPLAPRNDAGFGHSSHIFGRAKIDILKKSKSAVTHSGVENSKSKSTSTLSGVENSKSKSTSTHSGVGGDKSKTSKGTSTNQDTTENQRKLSACRLVSKVLSSAEINEVWKKTFIYRMKKALGITRLSGVLSEDLVNGAFVMHNCIYLNKSGTVTNIPQSDQLPQWVLSAMKCLARWPEHHEEGLPSYPGFEKDVFGVVKMYFLGLREPLIPFNLYDAITNVFVMASSRSSSQQDGYTSKEKDSIVQSLWTTASLENMILDLSKKYRLLDGTDNGLENEHLVENNFSEDFFQSQDDVHFVCNVNEMYEDSDIQHSCKNNDIQYDSSYRDFQPKRRPPQRQYLSRSTNSSSGLPQKKSHKSPMRKFGSTPNLKVSKYETAFGPDNCTVTRVFYQNGVSTDYGHCDEVKSNSFAPLETHFSASSENISSCEQPVNFERVRSLECVNLNKFQSKNSRCVTKSHCENFQRSKSFATRSDFDEDGCYSSLPRGKRGREWMKNHMNRTEEPRPTANTWASQDSLDAYNNHEGISERLYRRRRQFSQDCVPENKAENARSLPRSYSSYLTTEDPVSSYNFVNDDHTYVRRPTRSPSLQSMTPPNNNLLSPSDSVSYHSGYRPVLDASKERSMSVTDVSPPGLNPLRTKSVSTLNRSPTTHMTSTPLSPVNHCNANGVRNFQSNVSLSNVTPFYRSDARGQSISHVKNGFMSYPQTRLSEERAKNSLQMIMLLMTPGNRRKLHMLFKMMVKMATNPNLCLDPTQTTRSLVLGTFYPAILRTEKESDLDEMLVLQLLSFMLDYYDDIFTPPEDVKTHVSERLKEMQRPQISYSPRHTTPVQFCQKITVADYEKERNTISRQAMEDLLENIIKDTKMSSKDKRKRLKQFQKTYPTIYSRRFPNPEAEAQVLSDPMRPRLKQPLMAKPMNRLKGLRL